ADDRIRDSARQKILLTMGEEETGNGGQDSLGELPTLVSSLAVRKRAFLTMSYGSYGGGRYGSGGYSSGLGTPYSSLSAPTALRRSLSPSPGAYGADRPRSPMRTSGLSAYTAAGARMSPSRSPTLSRSYTGSRRASGGLATLL
ncbi:hypothetical protein ISCGN_020854, partial [Ixodes scapularis]